MFEDFINAIHNFRTNKMRTLLSLLGIVIGVTSVVIITTLAASLSNSIASQFDGFSMDIINIGIQGGDRPNRNRLKLDDCFRNMLIKKIPQIKNIFYTTRFTAGIVRNSLNVSSNVQAVEPERLEALRMQIDYGRFFSASDYVNGSQKVILGDVIASQLFPEGRAVGKSIVLQIAQINAPPYNFYFEVVGVLKPRNNWLIRSSEGVFVPKSFALKHFSRSKAAEMWSAEICVFDPAQVAKVENSIREVASDLTNGNRYAVWVYSAQKDFEQMSRVTGMVTLVLSFIAGISLLVGGVGIMNIMLVTVTERRKEIGIRKALGATSKAIRLQFLVESATLTLTGGIIGIVLGVVISKLLVNVVFPPEIVFSFNFGGTLISFGVSVFTGIFFGLHPAIKASHLDPIAALSD